VNRGEPGGLSFYRDRDGAEADLIVEHGSRRTLVEAKSARTASKSLFDGVQRVRDHLHEPSRPCDVVVAYGGDEVQTRSSGKLVPWTNLHLESWT
jgi:hypothetical protein